MFGLGSQLVIGACQTGVVRSPSVLEPRPGATEMAVTHRRALTPQHAPYGVNLILHPSNARLKDDFALCVAHKVPFVITSLGHPGEVADAVHGYGGLVFSDVIHAHHARKAIEAGVDGIVAVASGAGGHAGTQSVFSLIREIREFWDGGLIAGGAISDGYAVRAAEVLGADFAYMGTRFIATRESLAQPEYKDMLVAAGARDIVYTDVVSGTNANFLWPSLKRPATAARPPCPATARRTTRTWPTRPAPGRDNLERGHGVAGIHDVGAGAELGGAAGAGIPRRLRATAVRRAATLRLPPGRIAPRGHTAACGSRSPVVVR